ncbi:MAG: adenylosuccinate synthetase, partial [Bacteroidetes bacterium]|nr:adenylosuccinate synthetase [Bacteroidota bacterium]
KDVLNTFKTIKAGVNYHYAGSVINHIPFEYSYEKIEPVYKEFEGWNNDISGIKDPSDLPAQLTNYISFIEKETGVKIIMVSTGADRTQIVKR